MRLHYKVIHDVSNVNLCQPDMTKMNKIFTPHPPNLLFMFNSTSATVTCPRMVNYYRKQNTPCYTV